MTIGQNKKIAIVVVTIFAVSLMSVLGVLTKDHLLGSSDSFKIDLLSVMGHEESSYREFLKNSEDPVFAIELDGTLSYLSSGLEALLGYQPDELKGKLFLDMIGEKDVPSMTSEITKIMATGEAIDAVGPIRIMKKDGKFRYVLISAVALMSEHEKVARIVGNLKDITDSLEELKDEKKPTGDKGPKIRDTENPGVDPDNRLVMEPKKS